ncbi:MAG: MBL fold metallo-hydrolase [Deferribacteraceae bacterium]|jgi:glyoxylase-like metal-dependent hydrolase (beta-lactamase superfamily II)|nr:MBL fold metallo-hydrolase [Deferribacteraceae bacterium]
MDLIQVASDISVIDSGATMIGALRTAEGFTLIDSGFNRKQAKKIDKLCQNAVTAIYHTHTHADHIGGSAYFVENYSTKLYVPAAELSFAHMPELEGAMLSGGILPNASDNPFLLASAIPTATCIPDRPFTIGDHTITPISTAGHSPAHTAYLIDDTLFLGDAILSAENIKKHGILYLFNAEMAYKSLDLVQEIPYKTAVICHKGTFDRDECAELISLQRAHIERIKAVVLESVADNTAEEITKVVADKLSIPLIWEESWYLVSSTVKGYLCWLRRDGIIDKKYSDRLIWTES